MKKINVMTIVNNVDSLFPFKKLLNHTMTASAFITFTLIEYLSNAHSHDGSYSKTSYRFLASFWRYAIWQPWRTYILP